jgi:hypothetical protein
MLLFRFTQIYHSSSIDYADCNRLATILRVILDRFLGLTAPGTLNRDKNLACFGQVEIGDGQQKVEYRQRTVYDVPPLNKIRFSSLAEGRMALQLQGRV